MGQRKKGARSTLKEPFLLIPVLNTIASINKNRGVTSAAIFNSLRATLKTQSSVKIDKNRIYNHVRRAIRYGVAKNLLKVVPESYVLRSQANKLLGASSHQGRRPNRSPCPTTNRSSTASLKRAPKRTSNKDIAEKRDPTPPHKSGSVVPEQLPSTTDVRPPTYSRQNMGNDDAIVYVD